MMAPQFLRPLQTALQDTLGESALKSVKFEQASTAAPLSGSSITGYVSSEKRGFREPVYDSSGSAPDIGTLPRDNRNFWVAANSVYDPNRKVIRQVSTSELFAIWDYEGKLESRDWNPVTRAMVLNARLSSPPAKMIRSFVFTAGEILLSHSHTPPAVLKSHSALHTGKTSDIPFNPMEDTTDTRVKAAQADDAEVDLSQWADPNETPEMARARNLLRRGVARWWIKHQERVAMKWIEDMGEDVTQEDIQAINDCMRHNRGCSYWQTCK